MLTLINTDHHELDVFASLRVPGDDALRVNKLEKLG
jgi:hypothetical protein